MVTRQRNILKIIYLSIYNMTPRCRIHLLFHHSHLFPTSIIKNTTNKKGKNRSNQMKLLSQLLIIVISLLVVFVHANELKESDDGFHNGFASRVDIKSENSNHNDNDIADAAVVLIKPSFKSLYLAQIQNSYGEFGITIAMTRTGLIKAWNVDGKQFVSFNASSQLPPVSDIKLVKAISYGNNPGIYVLDRSSKMHIFYFSLAIDEKIMIGERHWKKQDSYSIQDTSNQGTKEDAVDSKKTCPSTNENCEKSSTSSMIGFSVLPGKDKKSEDDDRAIIVQFNKVEIQLEEIDFNSATAMDISGLDSMLIIGNNKGEVIFQDIKKDNMKRSIINFSHGVDESISSINVHQSSHEVYFSTKTGLVQSITYSASHPIRTSQEYTCYIPAGDEISVAAGFDHAKRSFIYATTKKGFFVAFNTKKVEDNKTTCKVIHKIRLSPNGGIFSLSLLQFFAIASNSETGELFLIELGGNEQSRPRIIGKALINEFFSGSSKSNPITLKSLVVRSLYSTFNKKSTITAMIIGSWKESDGGEKFNGQIVDLLYSPPQASIKDDNFTALGFLNVFSKLGPMIAIFIGIIIFITQSRKPRTATLPSMPGFPKGPRSHGFDDDYKDMLSRNEFRGSLDGRSMTANYGPVNDILRRDIGQGRDFARGDENDDDDNMAD